MELAWTSPPSETTTFERLYRAHFDYVWLVLRRLGVPPSDLEDAAHDVFLVLHRRAASFDGRRAALRTWLFGVARRVAQNHRRSAFRRGRKMQALQAAGEVSDGNTPNVEDWAERELVERFLSSLDEDKREIFVAVELEQMTVQQAATVLGCNRNTAATRLRAARLEMDRFAQSLVGRPVDLHRHRRRAPEAARQRVMAALLTPGLASKAAVTTLAGLAVPTKWLVTAAAVLGIGTTAVIVERTRPDEPSTEQIRERESVAAKGEPSSSSLATRLATAEAPAAAPEPTAAAPEPTAAAPEPIAAAPEPIAATPEPGSETAPAAMPVERQPKRASTRKRSEPLDDVEGQNRLLEGARTAAAAQRADRVIALSDEYERAYGDGLVALEMKLLRIEALCALDKRAQARGEAKLLAGPLPGLLQRRLQAISCIAEPSD